MTGVRVDTSTCVPLDTQALVRVSGPLGSNPAGIYEDGQGQRYYIKMLETAAHARNERLAAKLYALAGAPTLHYVPTLAENQVATVWVPLQKTHVAQLDARQRRQAQHWFGVHAWTANWDAVGLDGDNQGVVDGIVVTLDVGGALEFRGQGVPKGRAFGQRVHELDRLRQDPGNPEALRLFGGMDRAALAEAVAVVLQLGDRAIRQVVAAGRGRPGLADKLIARKADMERWLLA